MEIETITIKIIHLTLDHIIAVSIHQKLNIIWISMKVSFPRDFRGLDPGCPLADQVEVKGFRVLVLAQKSDVLAKGSHSTRSKHFRTLTIVILCLVEDPTFSFALLVDSYHQVPLNRVRPVMPVSKCVTTDSLLIKQDFDELKFSISASSEHRLTL